MPQPTPHTPARTVAGLMSGTSLDGIDAVVARLTGSGRELRFDVLAFRSIAYPEELQSMLFLNSVAETSSVYELSQLNVRLAYAYAKAVRQVCAEAGLAVADLDLIGSHGQTVHHVPDADDCAGRAVTSTLQIGDPSVLANLLGVPVVGDFRMADMALGGQGAPLVPYFDYVGFADPSETRALLNLGGIANLTVVPAGEGLEAVYAFDTGPGNMLIDTFAQRLLGRSYDASGEAAGRGTIDNTVLATLLEDRYFAQPPPKSTGRERFGGAFAERLLRLMPNGRPADVLATATALTAASVYQAYARFIRPQHTLDVVIASGGGVHNAFLMQKLTDSFAPIPVCSTAEFGIDPDAKEALCFAVLAHETMNRVPTNVPRVTGARRATILGKVCFPG